MILQAVKVRPIPEEAKKLLAMIQEKEEAKEIGIYYSGGWVAWLNFENSVEEINGDPMKDQEFIDFLKTWLFFWHGIEFPLDNGE